MTRARKCGYLLGLVCSLGRIYLYPASLAFQTESCSKEPWTCPFIRELSSEDLITDQVIYLTFFLTAGLENDPPLVFALFRTEVRIIDTVKRAALSRLLLETTLAAVPGELLEEKIAALALPSDKDDCKASESYLESASSLNCHATVPVPSSDDLHWWDKLGEYHFDVRPEWLDGDTCRNRQGAVGDFASITGGSPRKSL